MSRFEGLRRFFRLDRPADVDRAVQDELNFHFDSRVRELMEQGMSERAAREEAERRFGDVGMTRRVLEAIDRARASEQRRSQWWAGFFQDLRYAARGLRLKPGFTIGVVLTLGLGIGANATMFGIVDRLLFRPPPGLVRPEEVHRVYFARTGPDGTVFNGTNTGYQRYQDLREMARGLSDIALVLDPKFAVGTDATREERFQGLSASFWKLFGVQPALGRFFTADEDSLPEGARVVVLDYAYWQSAYGSRASVLGDRMRIGQHDYVIIGVAPRGFRGVMQQPAVGFLPAVTAIAEAGDASRTHTYGWSWPEVLVRRAPGTSVAAATASLTSAYQRSYDRQRVEQPGSSPAALARPHIVLGSVLSERGPRRSDDAKVALWLIGVSAIVLIIACANVGNLLLARAFGRRREIALRLALGISRSRLLVQLLTESVLLAALGGAAGVAAAQWGGGVLRATLLPDVAWTSTIADPRVLAFSGAVALLAGLLAGLAPALHAGRADVASALKSGVREGTYHRSRIRTVLLVMQSALSVMLLVGAGLFVRSFHNVRALPLGYDTDQLMVARLEMRGVQLDSTAAIALRERLADAARALPAVENSARILTVPFWSTWDMNLMVEGLDTAYLNRLDASLQAATPSYFATTGTRLLRGRGILAADGDHAPKVAVVSQSLAKALWPEKDAIGQCFRISDRTGPCITVVGIAQDVKHSDFRDDPGLNYYLPSDQWRPEIGWVMVRTRDLAVRHIEEVRRALQHEMPGSSYVTLKALSEVIDPQRRQWELGATMFTIFGVLALIVAAVGLYSVIAYGVAQRTHELGVRVALGAQAGDVVGLVVGEALRLAAIAAALGTAGALLTGRWIASLLFDTSPRDPWILGSVAAGLIVIAAVASLVPAWRAARVDPNLALRAD